MTFLLGLLAIFSGCQEDPKIQTMRLKDEAIRIHQATLEAILKNDLQFMIDLNKQDQFFAKLRRDLERCREIEAQLREISPGEDLAKLEKLTSDLELLISKREEQNQRYREKGEQGRSPGDPSQLAAGLDQTISVLAETAKSLKRTNQDSSGVEQFLKQLKKQRSEQVDDQ